MCVIGAWVCMSTRSGRRYKVSEAGDSMTREGEGDLVAMMKLLLEDRKKQEAQWAEERRRYDEERKQQDRERERALAEERKRQDELLAQEKQERERVLAEERERQDQQLKSLVALVEKASTESRTIEVMGTASSPKDSFSLTRLSDKDDVEAYLTTFERLMVAYKVDETLWVFKLAPQLTGRAQQAYAALSAEDAGSYKALKEAILARYDISEETYRQRFRTTTKKNGESHREMVVRLRDLQVKWTKGCKSLEELRDIVVMEQFLNTLPPDVRLW